MKYFIFTNWQTAQAFNWLLREYKREVRILAHHAGNEAADAMTKPDPDDMLRDADEMVFERLENSLKDFIEERAYEEYDCHEGESLFADLFLDALEAIDCRCIAKAIYYGVEPDSDPHQIIIPEISERPEEDDENNFGNS